MPLLIWSGHGRWENVLGYRLGLRRRRALRLGPPLIQLSSPLGVNIGDFWQGAIDEIPDMLRQVRVHRHRQEQNPGMENIPIKFGPPRLSKSQSGRNTRTTPVYKRRMITIVYNIYQLKATPPPVRKSACIPSRMLLLLILCLYM